MISFQKLETRPRVCVIELKRWNIRTLAVGRIVEYFIHTRTRAYINLSTRLNSVRTQFIIFNHSNGSVWTSIYVKYYDIILMACWRPRASRVADVGRSRFSVIFLFVHYGFMLVRKTEAVLFDWKVRGHGHRSIIRTGTVNCTDCKRPRTRTKP